MNGRGGTFTAWPPASGAAAGAHARGARRAGPPASATARSAWLRPRARRAPGRPGRSCSRAGSPTASKRHLHLLRVVERDLLDLHIKPRLLAVDALED